MEVDRGIDGTEESAVVVGDAGKSARAQAAGELVGRKRLAESIALHEAVAARLQKVHRVGVLGTHRTEVDSGAFGSRKQAGIEAARTLGRAGVARPHLGPRHPSAAQGPKRRTRRAQVVEAQGKALVGKAGKLIVIVGKQPGPNLRVGLDLESERARVA